MRSRPLFLVPLALALALAVVACKKPVDVVEQRKLLASEDPKVREQAAGVMKKLYADDPKAAGDPGEAYWAERVQKLPSMAEAEQKQILNQEIVSPQEGATGRYRLDDYWTTSVTHDASNKVTSASKPVHDPAVVTAKPPAGYAGSWVMYYVNGAVHETDEYAGGILKRVHEVYDDGKPRREAKYEDGKLHGQQLTYFPDGKVETDEMYEQGVPNGPRKVYFPTGAPRLDGAFVMGKTDGWLKSYRPDGSEEWCILYDKGREVERGCRPKNPAAPAPAPTSASAPPTPSVSAAPAPSAKP